MQRGRVLNTRCAETMQGYPNAHHSRDLHFFLAALIASVHRFLLTYLLMFY